MKNLALISVALCVSFATPAVLGRGSGSSSHGSSSMGGLPSTGGAFGTNPATPGTNSAGTALSSNAASNGPQKGPLLGTSPAVDQEEARVAKMMASVCRGC